MATRKLVSKRINVASGDYIGRDDEVVGKAVDGLARVELAHGRSRFLATRFVAGQVFF